MDEYLNEILPEGWEAEDDLLICPCGNTIEHDGRCPEGCVSPLLSMGLI
jgi:hypothetical protein